MDGELSLHLYNTIKFLHILLAMIWVGGGITIQVFAIRAMKAGPEHTQHFAETVHWVGNRVFMPASGILFLLGLWMSFGWMDWVWPTWIWIGIAGFAATFVTGSFFLGPATGRLDKLLKDKGPADPESIATIRRILGISRIDMVVLIIVVWDMVYKPFS